MHILNIYNIQKGSRGNIQVFFQQICHALLLNWVSRIFSAYIMHIYCINDTHKGVPRNHTSFFSTNLPHPYVKSVHTYIYCIFNKTLRVPRKATSVIGISIKNNTSEKRSTFHLERSERVKRSGSTYHL